MSNKTTITYSIESEHGFRRSYENVIESAGFHNSLVQAINDAIELFEARQIAHRKRYGLPEPTETEE